MEALDIIDRINTPEISDEPVQSDIYRSLMECCKELSFTDTDLYNTQNIENIKNHLKEKPKETIDYFDKNTQDMFSDDEFDSKSTCDEFISQGFLDEQLNVISSRFEIPRDDYFQKLVDSSSRCSSRKSSIDSTFTFISMKQH